MNYKKKLWLGCSVLALAGHAVALPAVVTAETWQARQLHEVLADVVVTEDNSVTYSVHYGDTLSVISEAMNIDVRYLASINNIDNVNLIFPETVLTAKYDENNQADSLTVEAPDAESIAVNIPVNLSPIETVEELEMIEVASVALVPAEEELTEIPADLPVESGNNNPIADSPEEELGAPAPEELPAEDLPVEEAPEAELPTEDLPVEEAPVEELPAEDLPVGEAPVEELPTEDLPIEETPEEELPTEDLPVEEAPVEELPAEEDPEEIIPEEPEYEEPIIEEPEYEEPIIEEPEYEEPEYEESIIEEPVYEEPAAPAPDLNGLAYNAAVFRDEIVNMYGVTAYGIRPGDAGDHGSGLAVDFMVPVGSDIGDAIANYAINNMGGHNISYVIWEQQIYGGWTGGWEWMEDRGSVTANHYDHVHVSFY